MGSILWIGSTTRLVSRSIFRQESASIRQLCNTPKAITNEEEQLRLIRNGTAPATGKRLDDISADVWGHNKNPAGSGYRSGERLLKKPLKGPLYTSWYPPLLRDVPVEMSKLTPKQERWREKLKILRAAGKGPPKKGEGKRSK